MEKKLKAFRCSLNETESVSSVRYTVRDYFLYWLKTYQFQKLKPSSYDRLESVVNNHILPVIGNVRFDLRTRDEVQRLINNAYRQKELSYFSVKKIYDALKECVSSDRVCVLSKPTVYKYMKKMGAEASSLPGESFEASETRMCKNIQNSS